MQRLVSRGLATQLCLWGEPGALSILRQRLHRILRTDQQRRAVYKIERVQQPDNRIRFDLFVSNVVANPLQNCIAQGAITHRYGWHIRPHIPYRERVPRRVAPVGAAPVLPAPASDAQRSQHLRMITYNINGVANKRTELRHFLEHTKCDVLGLQETLLKATDWHLRFPQFLCFTAMGDLTASTRGVAVVVANKFACSPVGRASPYWVFVRLFGAGLVNPVIVGSVYVPHRAGRNHVLTTLPLEIGRLKQAYPEDPVIVLGDWNLDLEEVQRETASWPYPAHTLANLGLVPTRRRGDRTIDHISYWGAPALGGVIPPPRVLTDWEKKKFDLKTAIGTIITQPLGIMNWTWTSGTSRWITRYCAKYFDAVTTDAGEVDWTQLEAGPLRNLVRDSITLREQNIRVKPTRPTSSTTALYFRSGYASNPLTKGRVYCRPTDNRGITIVLVCRIGAYPTAPQLVERKRLANRYKRQCPFCRAEGVPETLYHLLFICRAWRRQRRESGLQGTIAEIRRLEQRVAQATPAERNVLDSSGTLALSREELALSWILGGIHARTWGVRNYMPQPPLPAQAEDDQSYSSSSLSSDSISTGIAALGNRRRVTETPHLLKVGWFLVKIESARRRVLSPLSLVPPTQHRGNQGPRAPATSTGQSPNG